MGLPAEREAFCFKKRPNGTKMTVYFSQCRYERRRKRILQLCIRAFREEHRGMGTNFAPELSHAPQTGGCDMNWVCGGLNFRKLEEPLEVRE